MLAAGGRIWLAHAAGGYPSRSALLSIKGIGPKTYEQAAGFLRLRPARAGAGAASVAPPRSLAEPLDCTAVHPESYGAARRLLARLGRSEDELLTRDGRIPALVGEVEVRQHR